MDRLVNRVNEIADSDKTPGEKLMGYFVATFDTQIAELIRRGELREAGFVDIADLLEGPFTDADIDLAADAIARVWGYSDLAEADSVRGEGEGVRAAANAVLDVLRRRATGKHRGTAARAQATTAPR